MVTLLKNTLYLKACMLACLMFAGDPVTVAQKLSKEERKIIAIVDRNMKECVALLEEVVNINSGTENIAGVKKNADVMQRHFENTGFATEWIPLPAGMKRAGHLFAERKGTKGRRLLLIGHLDTVFEPGSPFQRLTFRDSLAYGPGVNDMKGGNLVILYALKALHQAGLLNNAQIIVALHGDEEEAGRPLSVSRQHIIAAAKRSDIALAFETGTGFGDATVARRGTTSWILEVKGKQAHSAGVFNPGVGAGAVYEAARILSAFYDELKEEYLTYNPGLVIAGTEISLDSSKTAGRAYGKSNVVAPAALVRGDIRYLSDEQRDRTIEKMKAIAAKNLPHTSASIVFEEGYPAMPPTEGNAKLLEVYSKVSVDLGLGPVKPFDPAKRGAGDISFVAKYLDCLDGLGAMGGGAHSNDEYMDLRTFDEQIKRAALLIYRLTR
jgi:glutamate carboxypeptidase